MILQSDNQFDDNVVDMFFYQDYVCLVTDNDIYGYMLPELTESDMLNEMKTIAMLDRNPSIFHKKRILGMGSGSLLVSRTYLTARKLFKEDRFAPHIKCQKAMQLSFDALMEMAEMFNEIHAFGEIVSNANKTSEEQMKQNSFFEIPSIPNVSTKCKTIFQKADHTCQTLMHICQLFYPDIIRDKKMQFPTLLNHLELKYGSNDDFVIFFNSVLPTIQLIRAMRNCLDHRLDEIKILDYCLNGDDNLLPPSFTLNYKEINIPKTEIAPFLQVVMDKVISMFEGFIYHLSLKSLVNDTSLMELKFIPKEQRKKNKFIQYGYWINIGNGIYE